MDKDFLGGSRLRQQAEHPMPAGLVATEACRMPSPAEVLHARAKELRDQAFRYEELARTLEHIPLSHAVADTLARVMGGGLYRA